MVFQKTLESNYRMRGLHVVDHSSNNNNNNNNNNNYNSSKADVLTLPPDSTEVERYREAMQRMGQDILTLRHQVAELEAQNNELRRGLHVYNNTSQLLLEAHELGSLPVPELTNRYGIPCILSVNK